MSRRTKLTPETQKKICDALKAGNTRHDSAVYAGIGESTFYVWLEKGERATSGIHREFVEAVKKAEADAIARNVALIQKAANDGSWQAAAWFLERRRSNDWGRRERIQSENQHAIEIRVNRSDESAGH